MREICQKTLPIKPWMEEKTRRLPGLNPVETGDWLRTDEAYAGQMAYREELLRDRLADVHRLKQSARPAAIELLERVLKEIVNMPDFTVVENRVTCPDGRQVTVDRSTPLITLGHLVQDDFVIMEEVDGEHAMTGAVLCFPASWSLAEKFNRGLLAIHQPVKEYTGDMGKRVQRLFDFIKPETPMWRANFLVYSNPDLHQPRREDNRRSIDREGKLWVRVERQCLLRLPVSRAVVFSIHSYVVPIEVLSDDEAAELHEQRSEKPQVL